MVPKIDPCLSCLYGHPVELAMSFNKRRRHCRTVKGVSQWSWCKTMKRVLNIFHTKSQSQLVTYPLCHLYTTPSSHLLIFIFNFFVFTIFSKFKMLHNHYTYRLHSTLLCILIGPTSWVMAHPDKCNCCHSWWLITQRPLTFCRTF